MFALLKMIDPGVPVPDPIEVLTFGSVMLMIIVLIYGTGLDSAVTDGSLRSCDVGCGIHTWLHSSSPRQVDGCHPAFHS
jgi:hypothetical protein